MRGPHVRFCERCRGVILCAYSTGRRTLIVVTQHKETRTDDAAGAGAEGGRRPTVVPDPAASFEEYDVEGSDLLTRHGLCGLSACGSLGPPTRRRPPAHQNNF
jgi:hypothetical protein